MIKKFLSIIFISTFFVSCRPFYEPVPKSWNWGLKPRPVIGTRGFPEADTDYGKGFKNGCSMGWDTSTKGAKDLIRPNLDPGMMAHSPDYNNGWFDGFEQCVYIVDWDVV